MKKLLLLGTSVLYFFNVAQAQKVTKLQPGEKGMHPSLIEFSASDAPSFRKGNVIVLQGDNFKTSFQSNAFFVKSEKDALGFEHFRYQQSLNGIPVEDAIYIMHVRSGKVLAENGKWVKDFPVGIARAAIINEDNALTNALRKVNAAFYKWEDADEESFIKTETGNPSATFYPKAKLVYYSAGNDIAPGNLHLAYKFDIYAKEPLSRQYVYVDAQNGSILGVKELIHTENAQGKAATVFSGIQSVQTTISNGSYILRETSRGNGIVTLNLQKKNNYNKAVDFKDDDNNWNNINGQKDQYAADAHWGAEKTYDFYMQTFNRNSIDGKGLTIKSYVHYSKNYFNAFWDGSSMTYGDGSSINNNKPLTSIDVCAHEITHGLTSFTANLNYSKESGALNEGFSDIFGTAVEWFARPSKKDWLIGADFYIIRSMSNPNAYSQPDTYKGIYWYTGTSDNGGVHTNSGVLNFWFYLLSTGGKGTNDMGYNYNVSGISITKAQAIAYRTLTNYLVPTSVYKDARTYSIKAAKDLYGENSNEATQTAKAWDAVGVTATTAGFVADESSVNAITGIAADIKVSKLYPNPTQSYLVLEFSDGKTAKRTVAIYDISGNLMFSKDITTVKGNNRVEINLPAFVNGNYMLMVDNVQSGMFSVKH